MLVSLTETFATLSAIDLSCIGCIGEVASHMVELIDYLLTNVDYFKRVITSAGNEADRCWFGMWRQDPYVELYQFLEKLGM